MPQTQTEPRPQSFGLADDVQLHGLDESGQGAPQASSGKRRVAVGRRGAGSKRASVDLDDGQESNEGDHGDAVDDLDASAGTDDSDSDNDSEEQDGDDGDTDDVSADSGDDDAEDEGDKKPAARSADSRSRKQLKAALDKQERELERIKGRLDGQDARNAQANAAQQARAAKDDEPDDPIDDLFDEMTGGDADSEEFVTAAQVKTKDKQRKNLRKLVDTEVKDAVSAHSDEDIRALFAIPGAREAYNEAHKSGAVDRLKKDHHTVSALVYALVKEQNTARITKLTDKHKTEVGKLKEQLRQIRLKEIPAGNGARGSAGTGSGTRRGAPNDLVAAMDQINRKYGNAPRQ